MFRLFRPMVARSIIAQLVHGGSILHDHNIVHRGICVCGVYSVYCTCWDSLADGFEDIHLGNIVVHCLKQWTACQFRTCTKSSGSQSMKLLCETVGGVPAHINIFTWLGVRCDDLSLGQDKFILIDVEESYSPGRRLDTSQTPFLSCSRQRPSSQQCRSLLRRISGH